MTYGGTPRAARDLEANGAQTFEEIAIDVLPGLGLDTRARFGSAVLARAPLPRQHESRLRVGVLQQRDTLFGELEDRKLGVGLAQQSVPDQLLDVAAHFGHAHVLEQSERAQLIVTAGDDLHRSRCRAGRW